jgi:hypothetical protein
LLEGPDPIGTIDEMLRKHLQWLQSLHVIPFIAVMVVYLQILKFLGAYPIGWLTNGTLTAVPSLKRIGFSYALLLTVILVPLIETVIGQWLPIWLVRFLSGRWVVLLIVSAVCFGLLHVFGPVRGMPLKFVIGFTTGLVFSFSFLCWERVSKWRAYAVTATVHALHNLVAIAVTWMGPAA